MSANELLQNWQESLKHALLEKSNTDMRDDEHLLRVVGLQVQTGILVGDSYNDDDKFCA